MRNQTTGVTIKLFLSLLLASPLLHLNLTAFGSSVTEPLLEEHVKIKARLNHVDAMVRQLDAAKPEDQKKIMSNIVKLLKDAILEHAAEEEQVTYTAVDKLAKSSKLKSTASMRYEHGIIRKWIEELDLQANQSQVKEFMRKANRLLGVVSTHFEKEENVLFPVLEQSMTEEEFRREILSKLDSHKSHS